MLPIHNPSQIDPALLTLKEWMKIVDPANKQHPESAYNYTVASLKDEWHSKSKFPKLLRRVKLAGLEIEIRLQMEKNRYVKTDENGDVLRVGSEVLYWTDEEAKRLGRKLEEYNIGVFHGEQQIGAIHDEWGCVLVYVVAEYQGIGLGTLLQKMARTMEPAKPSGGFTPSGRVGFGRVHREFVRDALKNGMYSKMVRSGQITLARVKEIIASTQMVKQTSSKHTTRNLNANDPKDWLLFVGEYGDFVLYDKKLKDLIEDGGERNDYFIETMIKGTVNVQTLEIPSIDDDVAIISLFGGDTDKIKQFMLKLALSYTKTENLKLFVDEADLYLIEPNFGKPVGTINLKTGYKRQEIKPVGDIVIYNLLGKAETLYRQRFDKYGEFKDRIQELAYSKFRIEY